MRLPLEDQVVWDAPEGYYRARLIYAGEHTNKKKPGADQVRLVFSLDYDDGTGREFKVQKIYAAKLSPGSELRKDLKLLLGEQVFQNQKDFELNDAVGAEAVIRVIHKHSDSGQYAKPYVTFDDILPLKLALEPTQESESYATRPA